MNILIRHIVFLSEIFLGTLVEAQSFLNASSYQVGLGGSSLLSDLGGAKGNGSNFIKDLDLKSVRFNNSYAIDWAVTNHLEYRTAFSFNYLSADDKYSGNHDRKKRNLSVNTSIFEITPTLKYNFIGSKESALKRWTKRSTTNIYLTLGAGLIYFNPKAKFDGKQVSLHNLTTEGQGLNGGANPYSKFSFVIPFGFGLSKEIAPLTSVFFELISRKCFTDYLDDVSTVYYDNASLAAINGEASAELADPNTSEFKNPQGTKRGNFKKNDSYFTFTFGYKKTLNFNLMENRPFKF